MTSSERIRRRLNAEAVDKVPNMNIVMGLAAKSAGVSYREYASDYRKLVEGNLICAERYGIDAVSSISDPMREASAFGAVVEMPENGVPYSALPLLQDPVDVKKLRIVDPHDSERTLDRIKAVELLREKVGKDYPVIGWVEGVLAETADLRGVNELMMDIAEEAPFLNEVFEIVFAQQCLFAKAQVDAGADFIGVGNAVASLLGPVYYERFAMDYDTKLTEYIHSLGAKVKLHICGNTTPLRELVRDRVKPDIFDIDWMVDFSSSVQMYKNSATAINGNMDPVGIMLQGDPDAVKKAVSACLSACDERTLIAAGCEIPAETPEQNLMLMDSLLYT